METQIYILVGLVVALIFYIWRIGVKFRKIKISFEKFRQDVEKLHREMDLVRGRLKQAETIELDFSVLDNKIEENTQQLFAAFREKVYELSKRMGDIEEDMNLLNEKLIENQESSDFEE